MDAITLLKQDHKTVEGLFKQFEKAGDDAQARKRALVDQMIRELSVHATIEELVFYPAVKGISEDLRDHVLESLEEHHVMKWLCKELDGLSPTDERFDAKTTVLIETVRHHVDEEEQEFFPIVREKLGRKVLGELGELLATAKKTAPTHPHPRAPDEPPGNVVAGMVAALVDRARDAGAGAISSVRGRNGAASSRGTRKATTRKATTRKATTRRATTRKATTRKATSRSRPAAKKATRAVRPAAKKATATAKKAAKSTRARATTARRRSSA
jgi:hemerythrin superfamily protein